MNFDDEFLRVKDVMSRYRVSRFTIRDWVRRGLFPAGLKIGRARRWPLSTLRAWEATLTEATA